MLSVLMIMNEFAPVNNCGAIPNTKLTKYLARENVQITLVANEIAPDAEVDENLLPQEMDRIRTIRVGHSRLYHATLGKTREKITNNGVKLKMKTETRPLRAKAVSLMKNTFFQLRTDDWRLTAKRQALQALDGQHFDVVYSSYPNVEAHHLARELVKAGVADHWIADFRDPMCYVEYDKFRYERSMRLQHSIERAADYITVVSEGAIEKFLPEDREQHKIEYIPNGYDSDDFQIEEIGDHAGGDTLRFFYAGSLYAGKRDLTVLFRAISELAQEGQIDPAKIRVEYAGNEWPVLVSYAQKYGLEDLCVNYGYITRTRVMEIMGEIDCSIVCSHNTAADQGVVTGKVFELLLVGKPILTVVTGDLPDSELGGIVRECNAGLVFEEATAERDYPALKAWLKKAYDQKQADGKLTSELDEQARSRYHYSSIAHRLYEIMETLCEKK